MNFLGAIFVRRFGAFVRWAFKGFKGKYQDTLDGPKTDDPINTISYDLVTTVIGIIILFILSMLIARYS
jgi:hypothetical protein